jgi:hypothetical protein
MRTVTGHHIRVMYEYILVRFKIWQCRRQHIQGREAKPLSGLYVIPSHISVVVNSRDVCWNTIFYSLGNILPREHETRIYATDFVISSQALTNLCHTVENSLTGINCLESDMVIWHGFQLADYVSNVTYTNAKTSALFRPYSKYGEKN